MQIRKKLGGVRALALASSILIPSVTFAQDATSGGANDPDDQASAPAFGEIVVTAQKREESLQKVPIAISAVGAETLANIGFDNLEDLTAVAPSLQLSNFGPIAYITLRGIGNENSTAGGDPGVSVHFDGVYLGRPVGSLFSAFDTERVEVLRGPQGTLYGRNSTGGSINYITNKPVFDQEFGLDATVGNYDFVRLRGFANLGLSDNIALRLVGFSEDRKGFTRNPAQPKNRPNDADNWGLRGHLLFELSSDVSILLSSSYVHAGGVGSHPELREPYPGTLTNTPLAGPPIPNGNNYLVNGVPLVNDLDPFIESNDLIQSQDNYLWVSSATIDWDLGPVAIKSITGYVKTKFDNVDDQDRSAKPLFSARFTENSEAFSQELQLLSNTGGPLTWILGAFYFHEDASRDSDFEGIAAEAIAAMANVPYGFTVGGDVTAESYALFGQATYELTPDLKITGGLRYTDDKKHGFNRGFQFRPPAYNAPVEGSWERVTYRIVADYTVNPDLLVYASYSTGYKSGGINQAVNAGLTNAVYDPEFVTAYEAGFKSTIANSVQLNTSFYWNEYDDLQFQIFGVFGPEAFNAAGATVRGVEVELKAAPADWLDLDSAIAYTDSEFDAQVIDGNQLDGNQVQRSPKWKVNVGGAIKHMFKDGGEIRLRGDFTYTGKIYYTPFNRTAGFDDPGGSDLAPSYENVDLRLIYTTSDERWTFEGYVTNVFDTVQIGNVFRAIGFEDIAGGGGPEQDSYRPPRQVGLRVGVNF